MPARFPRGRTPVPNPLFSFASGRRACSPSRSMSLTLATLLAAAVLLGKGALFLWNPPALGPAVKKSLRSPAWTYGLGAVAGAWFLWNVLHLGKAEQVAFLSGEVLFLVFVGIIVGSFLFVREFLMVRAAAALGLMLSGVFLGAAYQHYEAPARLVLVVLCYVVIVASLYFGTVPYRMRDLTGWLFARPALVRATGVACALWGLLLVGATFTY